MPMETALDAAAHETPDEAGPLGVWMFIASEILLFGGFLASYLMIRLGSPVCALGTPAWPEAGYTGGLLLATLNTALLLTSSFTMARAVSAAASGRTGAVRGNLAATVGLGLAFLGVKAAEYATKVHHGYYPGSEFLAANPGLTIFISFYYAMTGLHALHVAAGIGLNAFLLAAAGKARGEGYARRVDLAGLYWHFVDVVWVFIFPLFYLI